MTRQPKSMTRSLNMKMARIIRVESNSNSDDQEDCMCDEFNSNCLMMLLDLYGIMITTIALIR